jgi:H+/Cl- antiporter ClcA
MLSGFFKKEAVAFRVLILKSIALVLSYGSGLSVGKEGPYVHLAACVANALLCIRPFSTELGGNETKRSMMLAVHTACSALGIAATFGSPIGGVLFSIEVTSTYYLIHNYWRSFFASAVGAVTIKIVVSQQQVHLLESFRTNLPEIKNLASVKLIAFILTGICCGLLASLFIWLYQRVIVWKTKHAGILAKITPFGEVFCVALITGIVSFPLLFLRLDHASAVHALFTNNEIDLWYKQMFPGELLDPTHDAHVRGGIILATLIYTVVKLCLTAVSITLPIPYGIYIPLFAIGAAFGRSFGELFALIFPEENMEPNGFAAIGAAAVWWCNQNDIICSDHLRADQRSKLFCASIACSSYILWNRKLAKPFYL